LTPDRREIDADGRDLCYVLAEVVDAEGNLCPDATDLITFAVGGAGRNVGVDNGSQTSTEPFKADRRHAFHGKAMLIVQSDGRPGDITVTATAPDLKSDTVNILTK
ncbi:MAG: beta-galactosidase, partial [Terasakiella sp.]|nr:beta-galactosidase [Terasakiella sp.]